MTLRIDLSSDTIAAVSSASSLAVHVSSPILALCRKLINVGMDPATPLAAYRGDMLCLKVRSIGQAARLETNSHGTGFRCGYGGGSASPARVSATRASS